QGSRLYQVKNLAASPKELYDHCRARYLQMRVYSRILQLCWRRFRLRLRFYSVSGKAADILMWLRLSFPEKIVLLLALIFWVAFSAYATPGFAGTDVYLFRDAACNLIHGSGFRTASFEHSHSFQPLLYSSYTPLTQW